MDTDKTGKKYVDWDQVDEEPVKKGWIQTAKENPGLYIATLIAFLLVFVVFSCVLIYALTVIFDPAL